MFKCISSFVCFIVLLITLEFCLYNKEKNELMLLKKYIEYDIKNKNLKSFNNGKYKVVIEKDNYFIEVKRNILVRIKKFKTIKYVGLVN